MSSGGLKSFFKSKKGEDSIKKSKGKDSVTLETVSETTEVVITKTTTRVKVGKDAKPVENEKEKQLKFVPEPAVEFKLDYKSTEVTKIDIEDYDPKKLAPFTSGQSTPFFFICQCFDMVAEMKGANSVEKKKRILINMFKTYQILAPDELAEFFLFSTGRLDAEYLQEDLGVGNETMVKACSAATASDKKNIKEEINQKGDLGKVIEDRKSKTQTVDTFFKKTKCEKRLTFRYVFNEIKSLTKHSGQKDKENILQALIFQATGIECKYIIRFLQNGNFKMGCAKATVQAGLARCFYEFYSDTKFDSKPEDWEAAFRKTSHQYPNYKLIIKGMQNCGGDLAHLYRDCKLTPGVPCKPMLAKPTKDINIIFTRFEGKPFTCEYKYDGLRGQIHYHNGKITIYSRNLENMTAQYPDVCKNILDAIKPDVKDFIVDSEIVGMDHNTVDHFLTTGQNPPFPDPHEQSQEERRDREHPEPGVCLPVRLYLFQRRQFARIDSYSPP